jgi:hypothetical protein
LHAALPSALHAALHGALHGAFRFASRSAPRSALHSALQAVPKVKALSDETSPPQSQKRRSPTLRKLFDVTNQKFFHEQIELIFP